MQTFTLGFGHGWYRRAFDRNPLIRTTDRIEAVVLMLAITAMLLTTAVAAALATSVQDSRAQIYEQQHLTRHAVTATATADSRTETSYGSAAYIATARWNSDGIERTAEFEWPTALEAGQKIDIWVDDSGKRVPPPAPITQALLDAVMVALCLWIITFVALAGTARMLLGRLNRRRYEEWDEALDLLVYGGHRTHRQP
ncbi:MAG: hypothetical protein JST91_02290 [Actinobacteria bacterium]|nr:hypothetical protein [Actinomycetota bacterium]